MNEKLVMNALIKVVSVLHFHAKLYRYSKRNISALVDSEVKTERVEPCIDAQPSCFGVYEYEYFLYEVLSNCATEGIFGLWTCSRLPSIFIDTCSLLPGHVLENVY